MGNPRKLPYRHNVGIALFNTDGRVLIARRIGDDGPEIIFPNHAWQMPQGGIDPNEDPEAAARRELWEETNVTSARVLGRTEARLRYDFPEYSGPPHKLASFRGQEQIWFAMRFTGDESEIDVCSARGGAEPEFDMWRWETLETATDLVVPFKREVYRSVAAAFANWSHGPA